MSRLTRDGTAETVSRDQIIRHERGQGNIHFPCSAYHEQDWQPYPVDPYSCYMCDHTYDNRVGAILSLSPGSQRTQIVKIFVGETCNSYHRTMFYVLWVQFS